MRIRSLGALPFWRTSVGSARLAHSKISAPYNLCRDWTVGWEPACERMWPHPVWFLPDTRQFDFSCSRLTPGGKWRSRFGGEVSPKRMPRNTL